MMQAYIYICLMTAMLFKSTMSQSINCANPADIMFLLDGSDSINQQEWNQERNFVARMIQALDISPSTINVGFTVYSSNIDFHRGLTPFRPKIVLNAMAKMLEHPTGIATNTAAGIKKVRETFQNQPASRGNAPKIMIVITDGSSENPAETIRQAQIAKADGIRIIAVGVGNNVFLEELQEIATNQQKLYRAPDFAALRGIESDIRNMICRVITTTMSPGFTFRPPTPPPDIIPVDSGKICNNPGDIVFVVDGSDSINDVDFVRLKTFVANLIDNFEIGPDAIHVGIIVYSTLVGEKIGLYPPKNKIVLKALANNLDHPKFGTDTAAGIQAAREMISQQGRPNAPEIIVVITDGRSTNPRNTVVQANIAKAQGITMIAIGVGQDIFSEELTQIASSPKYVSEVADFRALANTVNVMRDLICTSITTQAVTTTTMMAPTPPPFIPPPADGLICNVPGDVIFVLDGSDSIKPNDWVRQRNFVNNLINNLEVGQPYIHISVVVYSSTIGAVVPLIPFKPKVVLNMEVAKLKQPRFGTDTALGIQKAREIVKTQGRANAPKLIIVVTDGKSTFPDNTMIQANMAKADGVTMISVGIGADIYADELIDIASSPSQFFKVIDFASLTNIIAELRDKICQVVQTTTVPPPTTPRPTTTTTEMSTPMPVQLTPCIESSTQADMVFLIDGQKTISPYSWMMETHFVSNFLDGLDIRPQYMHVGVVISDTVRGDEIGISPFKSRMHMKDLIHGLLHPDGDMDTAAGLRKVQNIFRNQGRRNAEKVMVFVTDGSSRSMYETNQEATRLKNMGVDVVTVGVGNMVNLAELTQMATNPALTLRTPNFNQFFGLLPRLQNVVCELLRKPETTTMQTTTPVPGLCDGCLIDQGVGFNPYPGDCTKFVQCWKQGDTIMSLVRSCPFGQFWDADAITCRPSFLVLCTADPCKHSTIGFTYGMKEYGCRAYWKCIDGFSVGHCCPRGSAYVDGMGCLEDARCTEECPPSGGIAVRPICDKKPHWDKRYYIEIVYGRGEIVRPCPAGTIFFEEKCSCDFGLSGLLPTTPDVLCQPAAFFPFDQNLHDQSLNRINVGLTNMRLTDLGTAYFNGHSEMNLWRFAGTDWGQHLVIKFKFRFDYSNKFIDYGGLPVDLGIDFDVNMNLISDYHMTDMDWRLWNQLRNVRTLNDWRQLLREFGQSRTFYIFLGTLGFKPGTSNSLQVVRILGTPEAYAAFQTVLDRIRANMMGNVNLNDRSTAGLKGILQQLRSMRGLINWDSIIAQLRGESHTGSTGSGGSSGTTIVDTINVNGENVPKPGSGQWRWDGISGQWVKVSGTTSGTGSIGGTMTGSSENILNFGGTDAASEWRWNSLTGQWERLASATGGSTSSADVQIINEMTGGTTGGTGAGSVSSWQWEATGSKAPITGTQTTLNMSQTLTGGVSGLAGMTWDDIMRELARAQNTTSGTWQWSTVGGTKAGSVDASRQAVEALLKQLKLGGGQTGNASWEWNAVTGTGSQGGSSDANRQAIEALLKQLNLGGGQTGSAAWEWSAVSGTGSQGGSMDANRQAIEALLKQLNLGGGQTGGNASWEWSAVTGTGSQGGSMDANRQAIENLLAQLKLAGSQSGGSSWQWTTSGGTASGQELDMAKLNSILKQMQEMAKSSETGSFNTSGTFITSGGQSAVISGGMGTNTGQQSQGQINSKRTIQTRFETEQPTGTATIVGGRVVGGAFGGVASQAAQSSGSSSGGQRSGSVTLVRETSSRRGGGGVGGAGQFEGRFTAQGGGASTSDAGTVVNLITETVPGVVQPSIPDRSAPRGAAARGVRKQDEGRIVGISVPAKSEFVSGATVIGRGEKAVRVTNTQPQFRVNEIIQEVNPMMFEASEGFARGSASGARGASSWQGSASGQARGAFGASSGGSGQFVGRQIITNATGMAGGDFTQMGKVVGSGGGIKRVIDTNVKRMPAGAVEFNANGGVSLASLGLGGAEGANIIRQSVRVEPVGNGQFTTGGGQFSGSISGSSSSGGGGRGFLSTNTLNQGSGTSSGQGSFSASGSFSGSSGSGSQGIMDMNALNRGSGGSFAAQRSMSAQGNAELFPLLPVFGDSAENLMEGLGKKRKRRSARKSRTKRAVNKNSYQALVTNCQGQDGQGPSIMIVANQGDVQFALKSYNNDPAVISVPAVEGWNDVTLIYDGRSLTGVVENWKGLHKASVSLQGNIERRQAGLLVGSCQGFASFHGEIDDLSVYKCLTPAIEELRDRIIL